MFQLLMKSPAGQRVLAENAKMPQVAIKPFFSMMRWTQDASRRETPP